jgi:hypothetical protein
MGERDMAQYRTHRRLVTPAYTVHAMNDLRDGMYESISQFARAMRERKDQAVDLALWINLFAIGEKNVRSSYEIQID